MTHPAQQYVMEECISDSSGSFFLSGMFSLKIIIFHKIQLKGASSIKNVKSTPSHMKEISVTCSLVIN